MKRRGSVFFGVSVRILTACLHGSQPAHAQTNYTDLSRNFGLGSGGFPDLVPLVGWWHFDEGTGTITADSSVNGNNGALSNSPAWASGMFSNALQFAAGSNQSVWVQPSGTVTGSFTVSAWVLPENSTGTLNFVSTRAGEKPTFDLKLYQGNSIYADIGNGSTWIQTGAAVSFVYTDGDWYNITYVVTPTNYLVYANGEYIGGGNYSASVPVLYDAGSGDSLTIGFQGYGIEFFIGTIDEVRIYACALSSNDVSNLYSNTDTVGDGIPNWWREEYFTNGLATNSSSCAMCDPDGDGFDNLQEYNFGTNPLETTNHPTNIPPYMADWWTFDAGTGTITEDSSGNENAGIAMNGPTWVEGMFSNALQFAAGSNQYVFVQPSGAVTGTFTVSAWVLPENTTDTLNFVSTRADYQPTFDLKLYQGQIYADIGDGNNWIQTGAAVPYAYTNGVWSFIAYVVTPTNYLIYADGAFLTSGAYSVSAPVLYDADSGGDLTIGYQGYGGIEYFIGAIDDVRIYDSELSSSNIAALYNTDTVGDGIPNWWRQEYFGSGSTTNIQTCASCAYTNSDLDNLQDYECGFDPLVPIVITTPTSVYSGMFSNTASIPAAGAGVSYSWTVSNGAITAGTNTTTVLWTAGNAGSATICVALSNSSSCSNGICTNIPVTPAYYIDYQNGLDARTNGTSPTSPWQHCPGDPNAGSGPVNTPLNPGDTVFFKGGVQYVLTNRNSLTWGSSIGNVGIQVFSGGTTNPITYIGNVWGGTNYAVITDNGGNGGSNSFYAFGPEPASIDYKPVTNVVITGFQIGPLGGGGLSLPSYTTNSATSATANTTSSAYQIYVTLDTDGEAPPNTSTTNPGFNQAQPVYCYLQNQNAGSIECTSVTYDGSLWSLSVSTPFWVWTNSNNSVIISGTATNSYLTFNSGGTNGYGEYDGAAYLHFSNGEVLTNLLTTWITPQSSAWGFQAWSTISNVTIASCKFYEIGWWQNSKPIGQLSIRGEGIETHSSAISGLTVTNCEFTKVFHGMDISYTAANNVAFPNDYFHDYIVWGLALSPANATATNLDVRDTLFDSIGWAYFPPYGTYYGASSMDYGLAGTGYHQDCLFYQVASAYTCTNVNFHGLTFQTRYTNSTASGLIALDGSVGCNIYNCLFNCPNYFLIDGQIWWNNEGNGNDGDSNNVVHVGIYNNTFVQNGPGGNWIFLGSYYPGNIWPPQQTVTIENNIGYDFGTGFTMLDYYLSNTGVCSNWVSDYNDWNSPSTEFFDVNGTQGTLTTMQTMFPWEVHSTNATPSFVSLAGGSGTNAFQNNYSITNGPTIGAGTNLSGLNLPGLQYNFNGQTNGRPATGPWNLGAY